MSPNIEQVSFSAVMGEFTPLLDEIADRAESESNSRLHRHLADFTKSTMKEFVEWMSKEGYVFAREVE